MRIQPASKKRGIALIIVMMVILVLSVLAGGFAYSMKVETKLARNTLWESDMEWLGRSGIEYGKWVLAMHLASPPPDSMYSGLDQIWAGGPGNATNELLANIVMKDHQLGPGKFTVTIQDLERKFSLAAINEANPTVLQKALMMAGADSSDIPAIVDSYFDWIDVDHNSHLAGAENEFYLNLPPPYSPYFAKNGPVDDVRELLLIKGMTEQVFWGTARVPPSNDLPDKGRPPRGRRMMTPYLESMQNPGRGVGLVDLFVPFHGAGAMVNVNTASAEVLELAGVPPEAASQLVSQRQQAPFFTVQEALGLIGGGVGPQVGAMAPMLTVQSRIFEITVDAEIGQYRRRYVALVDRRSRQDVRTMYFTWK